jgi:NAD-dependent dihydropyrimidine dehydrogenase PreA subunit
MYKITIESERCSGPFECGICMRSCPIAVFGTYPVNRQRGQVCEDWQIVPVFPDLCNGCAVCVTDCPERAIQLVWESGNNTNEKV